MRLAFAVIHKGVYHAFELVGDIVEPVKVCIAENIIKNVFGQDVLDYHFAHIFFCNFRVDLTLGKLMKSVALLNKGVVRLGLFLDKLA